MAASKDLMALHANLSYVSNKKQFKWNGDLESLKDFWISEFEGGKSESLLNIESKGSSVVLRFETVTVNFYPSTKTLQVQGPAKDQYTSKLAATLKKGSCFKRQDQATSEELTSIVEIPEVSLTTDSEPLISLKSVHDDRYEEFESFMKVQREFNSRIERQVSKNSMELNENTIELKDLDQRCKNHTKEVKLCCENRIEEVRSEISEEVQKLVKQITSLNSKLLSELKNLKNKASSTEDSIKLILHQLDEIKSKVCTSEQSLLEYIQETCVNSTRPNSQEPLLAHGTETCDPREIRSYAVATSNRYESLVEEDRSLEFSTPTSVQPTTSQPENHQQTTTTSPIPGAQPQIRQHKNQPTNAAELNQNQEHLNTSNGPVLLLGDSILRGIQQRRFAPNRFVNKQTITGGTREMKHHINHMQDKNDYDFIVIHTGTNDIDKLRINEIAANMENCILNLKARWPNARIALSGLTYVPREVNKNKSIDEMNCYYESLCENIGVTFINNKRVTTDTYGNINEQVFYDDVHLNNRIGTRKLVTNIKHHLGLRGRNAESLPRTSNTIADRRNTHFQRSARPQIVTQYRASNQISEPLQALNLLAEYIRESGMLLR